MDRVVLITGGSRGIGASAVRSFAASGYRVAFTYKSSVGAAESLADECGALAIRADSASEEDIIRAVDEVLRHFGRIDVLINNAAESSFSLLTDITTETWQRTIAVNLTAPFIYSRSVVPDMLSRKWGRIINVSSVWGIVGSSCESHYSASKAGLIGFTKALAQELGPSGITVNVVAPGVIATDMNASLGEQTMRQLAEQTPLCRIGTPEEVAQTLLFLAGDSASFITGAVLNVSGGFVV